MAAAGSSSRFAVTCGLMRQYMRDQQQGGAAPRPPPVTSLLPPTSDSDETDARTMQLFPATATGLSQQPPEAQTKEPLTIFYDGRVLVFDDFPAEKAKELMQLAGSEEPSREPEPAKKVAPSSVVPALSDLPIARKASLQRFLQKRKHRCATPSRKFMDHVMMTTLVRAFEVPPKVERLHGRGCAQDIYTGSGFASLTLLYTDNHYDIIYPCVPLCSEFKPTCFPVP